MSRVSRTAALFRRAAASAHAPSRDLPTLGGVAGERSFARASRAPLAAWTTSTASASSDWPLGFGARPGSSRGKSTRAGALNGGGAAFNDKPKSLEVAEDAGVGSDADRARPNVFVRMALSLGGFYSTESTNQRAADRLYAAITAQCDGEAFTKTFGIERSFRGEHSALVLHVWLVLRRLREEGESGKALAQTLYDTFQDDVEHRVHAEGVRVRVNKWLNELEQGFYGSALAYDNALTGGQGDLAKVLHRNVFHGEDDASNARAQRLERYVRLTLGCLAATDGKAVREGRVRFSGVE